MKKEIIIKIQEVLKTKSTNELLEEYFYLKETIIEKKALETYFYLLTKELVSRNHIVYRKK